MTPLLVALGAAVGAPLRYLLGRALDRRAPGSTAWNLHWGTLVVNLAGSFLLGALVGGGASGHAMALLGTGFCGGLTTYSSFTVQAVENERLRSAAYVVLTICGCVLSATLGHWVATDLS